MLLRFPSPAAPSATSRTRAAGAVSRWSRVLRVGAVVMTAAMVGAVAAVAEPVDPDASRPSWSGVARTPAVAPATAQMVEPFRGSGTWIDVYDWSARYGGTAFTLRDVDTVAAAGYQTLYVQTTKSSHKDLVLEPARLKAIIKRAHQRGLDVVGWYLPSHDDEMRDYRKTIAMLRLGVDGIGLDLESTLVKDVTKRSAAAVRLMRRVSARIKATGANVGLAAITYTPYTLESSTRLWPDFPWAALAPYTTAWMPMSYWSQQIKRRNGYADAARFSDATITRMRQLVGDDARIHLIGGSGMSSTQVSKMVSVTMAAGGSVIGASLYDWRTTRSAAHPFMLPLRSLRTSLPDATSEPVAASDVVAFVNGRSTVTVTRVRSDGSTWDTRTVMGAATGMPSIAVDNQPRRNRWFVAAPLASGVGSAWGSLASSAVKLTAVPKAPRLCAPTAARWSHTGFLLICRNTTAVSFAVLDASTHVWSAWQRVPIPGTASDLVAAPLGSQVVLAWRTNTTAVQIALWDPAIPTSMTPVSVIGPDAQPLQTTAALRLNAWIADGSDTAANSLLSMRTAGGTVDLHITRASFESPNVVVDVPSRDNSTGPATTVFVDADRTMRARLVSNAIVYMPTSAR